MKSMPAWVKSLCSWPVWNKCPFPTVGIPLRSTSKIGLRIPVVVVQQPHGDNKNKNNKTMTMTTTSTLYPLYSDDKGGLLEALFGKRHYTALHCLVECVQVAAQAVQPQNKCTLTERERDGACTPIATALECIHACETQQWVIWYVPLPYSSIVNEESAGWGGGHGCL